MTMAALAFYLKMGLIYVLSGVQILSGIIFCNEKNEHKYFDEWSSGDSFSIEENTFIIEKNPDKDFVILNLSDIQLSDEDAHGYYGDLAEATIDKLIKDTSPDLITLSGDNVYGWLGWIWLIDLMDSYKIPWAPIFGNHDGATATYASWCAYQIERYSEYAIWDFGPENMGHGNYIITITENKKPVHQLYMMDTHKNATYEVNGYTYNGYDHLWDNQIEWYKWAVNGTSAENCGIVESTVIYHIPNVEYHDAWYDAYDYSVQDFKSEYEGAFGYNREGVSSAPVNNGFFDVVKELGSTKHIICGHNHRNYSSIPYQGVWLHYGVKTGAGCYWDEDVSGGKLFCVKSDGTLTAENIFVDSTQFEIDYSVPYPGYSE